MPSANEQHPDTTPGNYYVTVVDAGRIGLLAGPFINDHAAALAMVKRAKELAIAKNPWAHFYSYGTVRMACDRPGLFNRELGL